MQFSLECLSMEHRIVGSAVSIARLRCNGMCMLRSLYLGGLEEAQKFKVIPSCRRSWETVSKKRQWKGKAMGLREEN